MDTNIIPLTKIISPQGVELAYRFRNTRETGPTIVFLGGYGSDMDGTKALALDAFCAEQGYNLLRLDYSGHGASGGEFRDGTIGSWTLDALHIIDHATSGPLLLIGSSMGGWIGLLIAKLRPERMRAFIGIAAAPDFTQWVWNKHLTPEQQSFCKKHGYIDSGEGKVMTLALFEDGKDHLVLDKPLELNMPVTLLQGKLDREVPWILAEKLANHITPSPAELVLINDGDHRLARENDLKLLMLVVQKAIQRIWS